MNEIREWGIALGAAALVPIAVSGCRPTNGAPAGAPQAAAVGQPAPVYPASPPPPGYPGTYYSAPPPGYVAPAGPQPAYGSRPIASAPPPTYQGQPVRSPAAPPPGAQPGYPPPQGPSTPPANAPAPAATLSPTDPSTLRAILAGIQGALQGTLVASGSLPVDLTEAGLKAQALRLAPGMQPEGEELKQALATGQHAVMMVTLQAGKCYTLVGFSPPGAVTELDLNLLAPPFYATLAGQNLSHDNAPSIGPSPNPMCPIIAFPLEYKLDVFAKSGSGQVAVQLYSKAKR